MPCQSIQYREQYTGSGPRNARCVPIRHKQGHEDAALKRKASVHGTQLERTLRCRSERHSAELRSTRLRCSTPRSQWKRQARYPSHCCTRRPGIEEQSTSHQRVSVPASTTARRAPSQPSKRAAISRRVPQSRASQAR
eukprot:5998045-Pleurochrysis_carterae.AAC.3